MDSFGAEEGGLSARRLFSADLPEPGSSVELGAEVAQHLRVLRLAAGDDVELFDGRGRKVTVRVEELEKRSARCVALSPIESVPPGPRVVLVQCVPKAAKLDDIVRMTTELGVASIQLALSERCVSRPRGERGDHKVERLSRIASEAARQSEQAYVPEIVAPAPLEEVLMRAPTKALRVAFMERSAGALAHHPEADEMWLAVGPEGGFSNADRMVLTQSGFVSASLGRSILRTETAAVVGVALGLERLGQRR